MDTFLEWAVVVLPTLVFLVLAALPADRLSREHKWPWRFALCFFGLFISSITFLEQQRQSDQADRQIGESRAMQKIAEEQQKLTQEKLDQNLQEQQHLLQQQRRDRDLIHDLQTDVRAADDTNKLLIEWLSPELREKAEKIPKHYVRDVYEDIRTDVTVEGTVTKSPAKP